jgi:hypothetical protein
MKNIEIIYKKVEDLTKKELDFMNSARLKKYGKDSKVDFKKEDIEAIFILLKENKKIVAFGMLKPVKINYLGRSYTILGMGRGMAINQGKGYGRILSAARILYIKKTGKSTVAFTSTKNKKFFEKSGFQFEKDFIKRFQYKDPKTGKIKIDSDGHGVYINGKDNLIKKMLKTKSIAYTNADFW